MDHPWAGKVMVAHDSEPALPVPGPMGNHRVDESRDHDGVDDVGHKVTALGQGPRDEGGGGGGEHELEEPFGQLVAWGIETGGEKMRIEKDKEKLNPEDNIDKRISADPLSFLA